MGLCNFYDPQVMRKYFVKFMSNEFSPPYIKPHAIFKNPPR